MGKRVCIIANSPLFESNIAVERAHKAELVIVADGAAKRVSPEIVPHVICGDFDSVTVEECAALFPGVECVHDQCQETNDLEKCIKLALARDATEISIVCAQGGRLDHSLITLSLLERYHRDARIELHHGEMCCRVLSDADSERALGVSIGDTVSLIPRGDGATVSVTGVRWPLNRELLTAGSRGVSNIALHDVVRLTVHSGVLFFISGPGELDL